MSHETIYEKIIRQFVKGVSGKEHKEYLEKFCSQDMILYNRDNVFKGLDEVKEVNQQLVEAVPDLQYCIEDILIQGHTVAMRWRATGTAVKDYGDFKAGDPADHWGLSQFEFKDGLISKNWCVPSKRDLFR